MPLCRGTPTRDSAELFAFASLGVVEQLGQ
jgi:hypothetical protein